MGLYMGMIIQSIHNQKKEKKPYTNDHLDKKIKSLKK
jgi:hypothetical protein